MIRATTIFGWPLVLLALVCSASVAAADSMRCGSRLVSVEARAGEVLAICGEPSYRDDRPFQQPGGNWVSDTEEWTYNFGSNQLLRVLSFRNGRLVDIASDGYGFPRSAGSRCEPNGIVEGLSKYRLLMACGQPLTRQTFSGYRPYSEGNSGDGFRRGNQYVVPIYREEWVYNFGARYLLRIVTLDNGRVSDVQNGQRGSDTP